jgi:hypothetical protein
MPNPPPVGAQDAEKCSHLLTPHFAHEHEMSFRIKYLCAVAIKPFSNHQKKLANVSIAAYFLLGPAIAPDMWASRTVACPRPEVCRWRRRSLWLISLPPQREPRCEAVGSPLTPRSQVLTFLRCVPRTEANPNMFSACFSARPCLRVKKHPNTRCNPDPDGTVGVPLCQGDCGRRFRAASGERAAPIAGCGISARSSGQ